MLSYTPFTITVAVLGAIVAGWAAVMLAGERRYRGVHTGRRIQRAERPVASWPAARTMQEIAAGDDIAAFMAAHPDPHPEMGSAADRTFWHGRFGEIEPAFREALHAVTSQFDVRHVVSAVADGTRVRTASVFA